MAVMAITSIVLVACGSKDKQVAVPEDATAPVAINAYGEEAKEGEPSEEGLPFSTESIHEHVVLDYDNRTIRIDADKTISTPAKMKDKKNCFIVMSKKDYYLYVYEPQGADTVMLARYDCAFSLKKGQKEMPGDMKTPHCTMQNPFTIQEIVPASSWSHDFGDGRGSIKAYGDYFLRLVTPGHKGIGIHGSTNNRESVPGRASEGCIRLKDEDIMELATTYVTPGMKVIIKAENVDDLPFEIHAMKKQGIERKRHLNPAKTLSNEQIAAAKAEQGRVKGQAVASEEPAAATAAPRNVKVTGANVCLRLSPSVDGEILKDANGNPLYPAKDDKLPCKSSVGDWFMVTYQGKTVYINTKYATPQ